MLISEYVCSFMIYSLMGWIYETIFCTIKDKKWENRGFLYGPVVPIYGFGAITISIIIKLLKANNIALDIWQVFIVSALDSAILEYLTSWALEKMFHAKWWDYSKLPLNIKGRISLLTTSAFGLAGILLTYYIVPFVESFIRLFTPLTIELLSLIFMSVIVADLTLTVTALLHFDKVIINIDEKIENNMNNLVDNVIQKTTNIRNEMNIRQEYLKERWNSMNFLSRNAIRRVGYFDYDEKDIEDIKRLFLFNSKKGSSNTNHDK